MRDNSDCPLSIVDISRLTYARERQRTGLFWVEGLRFLHSAVAHGAAIVEVVMARKLLDHADGRKLAFALAEKGTPLLRVSTREFRRLSVASTPSGIGAVVRQRWERLAAPMTPLPPYTVWVEHLQSPGNLGTLLRTCGALGDTAAVFTGDTDPFHPSTLRATMGAIFCQRLLRASFDELRRWCEESDVLVVGASGDAELDFRRVAYRHPTLLVLGSERQGLSDRQRSVCDVFAKIPMRGTVDSLNVAVAAGIVLYEMHSPRNAVAGHRRARRRRSRRR